MYSLFLIPPLIVFIVIFSILFFDGKDLITETQDKFDFIIGISYLSGLITLFCTAAYWILLLIILGVKSLWI